MTAVIGVIMVIALRGRALTERIVKAVRLYFFVRKEVFLCVYFKESQWANTAPVAGIVQSTYALVARLSAMAAMP